MHDYEKYLLRLKNTPANNNSARAIAIDVAISYLVNAGVEDLPKGSRMFTAEGSELTLGQFVKSSRRALRPPVTQVKLAERAGIGPDWERKLEQDSAQRVSTEAMCRIGIGLGMSNEAIKDMVVTYTPKDVQVAGLTADYLIPALKREYEKSGRLPRGKFKI